MLCLNCFVVDVGVSVVGVDVVVVSERVSVVFLLKVERRKEQSREEK